jgi:hypothetical protein
MKRSESVRNGGYGVKFKGADGSWLGRMTGGLMGRVKRWMSDDRLSGRVVMEPMESRQMLAATPTAVGGDIEVATAITPTTRLKPKIATESDGSFVMTWHSVNLDGSGNAVVKQAFSAAGTAGPLMAVNDTLTGDQQSPQVAMNSKGEHVVVWESKNQDGAGWGVYAKRYSTTGKALGSEFLVNTITTGDEMKPSVAMAEDGSFVVVWQSDDTGPYVEIRGQRFDAAGAKVGSEFDVSASDQFAEEPKVAMAPDGSFVVAWQVFGFEGGNGDDIAGRVYDASGNAQGPAFLINTITAKGDFSPSVAMAEDGSFVVGWSSFVPSGSTDVFAQRHNSQGYKQGTQFRVNTYTGSSQSAVDLSIDKNGRIVAVWSGFTQDGNTSGVYGQLYDNDGNKLGDEFRVTTRGVQDSSYPAVAMREDNSFVVSWQEVDFFTTDWPETIYAQIMTADAPVTLTHALGEKVAWTDSTSTSYDLGQVFWDPEKNITYTVESHDNPGLASVSISEGVLTLSHPWGLAGSAQIVITASDGNSQVTDTLDFTLVNRPVVLGSESRVNTYTTGDQARPTVAMAGDDSYVVVWDLAGAGTNSGVYAQRYSSSGAKVGSELRVESYSTGDQTAASIAVGGDGSFVIAWQSAGQDGAGLGIFAQRFDSQGSKVGGEFQVNTYTTSDQMNASVAAAEDGGFVVVWESEGQDGALLGVYGQRFNSAGAKAGGEFQVAQSTVESQYAPTVAMTPGGDFMVSWIHELPGAFRAIAARMYDAYGNAQDGEFLVSQSTGFPAGPHVAVTPEGQYMVAWNDLDGSEIDIHGRLIDRNGAFVGSQLQIDNSLAPSGAWVSANASGVYVVMWESLNQDGSGYGVYGQRIDGEGNNLGGNFLINQTTTGDQRMGGVALNSQGGFVGVWSSPGQDGSAGAIYRRVFTPNTAPVSNGALDDIVVDEDAGTLVYNLGDYYSDGETADSGLTYVWQSNSNPGLVTASISSGVLTLNVKPDLFGKANITLLVGDGTNWTTDTIRLTVNPVNDAPSVPVVSDPVAVNEDAGTQTIKGWTSASTGPANELPESRSYEVQTVLGGGLLSSIGVSSKGELTYTPASDAFGQVVFKVRAFDGTDYSGWSMDATITINPVNDLPVIIGEPENLVVEHSGGAQSVSKWISFDLGGGNNEGETATFVININEGGELLESGIAIDGTGTLSFTPTGKGLGTVMFDVKLTDGSGSYTDVKAFTIQITDTTAPVLTGYGDYTLPFIGATAFVDVTFSEQVDAGGFGWKSVTLTRDGGGNLVDSVSGKDLALVHVSGSQYTIQGLAGLTHHVGAYVLTVVAGGVVDMAGVANAEAGTVMFNVGTDMASTPVLATGLEAVPGSGYVTTLSPVVTGTTTPGATVEIFEFTESVGKGTADDQGKYSIQVTLTGQGMHWVDAQATSPFNFQVRTAPLTIVVDTLAPTAINISAYPVPRTLPVLAVDIRMSAEVNLATFDVDDIMLTHNGGPDLAVAGSGITVEASAPQAHIYRIKMPASLVKGLGNYSLTVNAGGIQNMAGSAFSNSKTSTWQLIAAVPSAPTLDAGSEGVPGSGYTKLSTPTVTGTGTAGSTVQIYEGGTLLATTTVGGDGKYSTVLPTLSQGAHVTKALALEGAGGGPTAASADYTLVVDGAIPAIANMSAYAAPRTNPVTTTGIRFTSAMDLSTITSADLTLTRDGVPVGLSGVTIVETNAASHIYTLTLPTGSNELPGVYVLTATGAGIKNLAGNVVSNNYATTWTVLPKVVNTSAYSAPRSTALTATGARFSSPVNLATFTWEDLLLTRDGGANLIASGAGISIVGTGDPLLYTINLPGGLSADPGNYVLTILGSGIQSTTGLTVSNNGTITWTKV